MNNTTSQFSRGNVDQSGFTLIELVVSMAVFGLILITAFQLFLTANNTFKTVGEETVQLSNVQVATQLLAKEVRNSTAQTLSDDGKELSITDGSDDITTWRVGDRGLTNGSFTFEQINEVAFRKVGKAIEVDLTYGDDTLTDSLYPRVYSGTGATLVTVSRGYCPSMNNVNVC